MSHTTPIDIRFADIDKMGHVNNAKYLTYFEQARVRYFDDVVGTGIYWSETGLILARAEVNFVAPVDIGDKVYVNTFCSKIGNKSFNLGYQMFKKENNKETEVANGTSVLVCYDYNKRTPIVMPETWRNKILNFEGMK